jgi:hypothetical protein
MRVGEPGHSEPVAELSAIWSSRRGTASVRWRGGRGGEHCLPPLLLTVPNRPSVTQTFATSIVVYQYASHGHVRPHEAPRPRNALWPPMNAVADAIAKPNAREIVQHAVVALTFSLLYREIGPGTRANLLDFRRSAREMTSRRPFQPSTGRPVGRSSMLNVGGKRQRRPKKRRSRQTSHTGINRRLVAAPGPRRTIDAPFWPSRFGHSRPTLPKLAVGLQHSFGRGSCVFLTART